MHSPESPFSVLWPRKALPHATEDTCKNIPPNIICKSKKTPQKPGKTRMLLHSRMNETIMIYSHDRILYQVQPCTAWMLKNTTVREFTHKRLYSILQIPFV